MKKRICALLLALLLFSLAAPALAEPYVSLGSCTVGEPLSIFLGSTSTAIPVSSDGLPPGCRVQLNNMDGIVYLSLEGTPEAPGTYYFSVLTEIPTLCSLEVLPAAAQQVRIEGASLCRIGQDVELRCVVTGAGGALSYQWYESLGFFSAPMERETASTLRPDTSRAGTYSYSCAVTGATGSLQSEVFTLTVTEAQLRSVSIESLPLKTAYQVGEAIDTAGLRLRLSFYDGSTQTVAEGFTVSPQVFTQPGTQNVYIYYDNLSCGFSVQVQEARQSVRSLGILSLPRKTSYKLGETLETDGLSVRAYLSDGRQLDVSTGLECSPTVLRQAGRQTVTVRYAGAECSFSVDVEEEKRITGISVLNPPANRSYTVGDMISVAGLMLQVNTTQGSETVTNGYTYTPRVVTAAGTQEITVLYQGQSTSFTVEVQPRSAPTPTPRPSPTPTPESAQTLTPTPAATRSPVYTPYPARRNTGVSGMVIALLVIALLALAGLVGYVWYLRRQGFEEDAPRGCEREDCRSENGGRRRR